MSFSYANARSPKRYGLFTAISFIIAVCLFPLLSCKVGLGGTIDTTPPSNTITYPPKNAVVRSTFVIAGTCNDDLNVESVTVNITNTDTRKSYGPFQADLASDKKSWSIKFNKEKHDVPNHPYAGWDYPDGHYSVTAYATDTSGKNSDTTANAFIIDNTPPVLILTSPSSAGTLEPDKFGRTISFTGTYAEDTDNKIAEMKVRLFKKSDSSKIGQITFQNIDHMAENNKYVIAQYFSKPESNLTDEERHLFNNYKTIFGETNVNNYTNNIGTTEDLPVYMTLLLSDGARVYNDPSNPAGSGPGNQTAHYYRNTDGIIDNFTKTDAAYPMSIFEIKDFLNGTSKKYTEDTAVTNIANALDGAKSAEYNAEETALAAADQPKATTLSINPKANPTFIVSGYAKDTSGGTSSSYDSHGFYYYTNGAPFSIVISSGADNVPVKYTDNNVTVYAVPADSDGNYSPALPGDWLTSENPPDTLPADWIEVKKITGQGNKTSYTINEALSGLIPNKRYGFAVWGKDVNGMPIEPDKKGPYVFVVQSSGNKPVISIGAQDTSDGKNTNLEEGSIASGNILASSYAPSANKLIFKGTATPGGSPIASVTAEVVSIENVDTPATEPSNSLSLSVPSSPLTNWETVVTEVSPLPAGNYKVKFKFTVEDTAHSESSVTRTLYIDKKAPDLTVENIQNSELIKEDNSYIQTSASGRRYSFRGKWSDKNGKGTKTLEYSTDGGSSWNAVTDSANGSAVPQVTTEALWTANIDITEQENYKIKFRATDGAGLQTESIEYTGIKFDFSAPTISPLEAAVNTTPTDTDVAGKYINKAMVGKKLTVKARVSDTFSLGSTDSAVEANITATAQHNGTSCTASDLTITKTPSTNKKSADVTFSFTIPSDGTKDGAWTFTVKAKDAVGRDAVAEQSVGVTVDTAEPAWKTAGTAGPAPYISSENTGEWYNRTSLLVKAFAEDSGSGIDKLQYKLSDSSNWNDVGNGNFTFTCSDTFNGTVTVRAIDKAGNTLEKDIGVKIDTAAPAACTLGTVDGQNGVTAKLVTGTSPVVFTFTASDAGASGIKSVEVVKIGNTVPSPAISASESGGTYTVSIPHDKLADGAVTVRLTDNAGNTADFALFTLQLDTAAPTVKINTPASGATVNKTITVSGTAVDNREIADKVEIFIKTGAGTDDWEAYKTTPAITDITDGSWKFKLNTAKDDNTTNTAAPTSGGIGTYDSDSGKPGRQLTFKITAKDAAGNVKSEERTVTVDQNADRPVIRLTNVPLTGMTASNPVWLKGTNTIYGSITDDDGEVISFQYSTDNGSTWTPITISGGSWNLTLSDGPKTILFKVKDAANTEFTSLATDSMSAPRLADGTSPKLYLNVDTHAPEMRNVQISRNGTDWSDDFKTVGGKELMLGGKTDSGDPAKGGSEKFYIKFEAKDANGIDENKLSVKVSNLTNDSGTSMTEHTYTTAEAGTNETHVTVTSDQAADGWKTYTFGNIPCKSGSGTMKLEIVATDKAGNTSPIAREAKVDNTAPKVEFSSPVTVTSSGISPTKGNTRVSGEIDDSKAQVWVAVSPSQAFSPDSDTASNNSYNYVDSLGIEYPASISPFDPSKTKYEPVRDVSARWYVMFDGDGDPAATGTHSLKLNDWLIGLGITTQADIASTAYDKITKLYVWIKATDAHGNTKEYKFPIWHDPQGDRPSVTIDYPANKAKLGGTVRLAGNATDNNEPKAVFVQILSGDAQIAAGAPTAAELNDWKNQYHYPVYLMSGSGSSGTEWNGTPASGKTAADYGILATLNGGSWSLTINENGEFNPSGNDPNKVKITAYAYDEVNSQGKSNKSLPKSVNVTFDKNNPVFGSIQLVKSANENLSTPNSAPQTTASGGTYSVKDTWYICGSVADADTIKKLTLKDGSTAYTLITGGNPVSGSGNWDVTKTSDGKKAEFKYKLNTAVGVGECPIEIEAYDATTQEYNSKYTLTIKYDNEAPVLLMPSETGYNIKADISQSDSFYTFGSKVKEDAVGGKAQSGFKRLAFFFMRRIGSNIVYDPMLVKTDPKNKLTIGGNISYDSGLYWKEYSSVSWSDSNPAVLTFTKDDNVHTGGLVQANGTIYRIQSVSATGITLDSALAANPGTTVKVALALIVDHLSAEGGVTSAALGADGYYSTGNMLNDDGDRMIESVSKTGTVWTWEASICSRNIPDGPIELHYVAFDEAGNYSVGVVSNVDYTTFQGYSTDDKSDPHLQVSAYAYDSAKPAFVSNNRPRIAGVIFGTDYNGNGTIDAGEKITAYRAPKTKGEYDADNGDHVPGITSLTGFTAGNKAVYDLSRMQYKYPSRKAVELATDLTLDVTADMTVRGYTEITPEIVGGNGAIYYQYNLPVIGNGVNTTPFISSGTTDYTIAEGAINLQFGDILKLSDAAESTKDLVFTFWDSTEGAALITTAGTGWQAGRQKASLNVKMKFAGKTPAAPTTKIQPFYWNSENDNSLYDNSKENGHLEVESGLPDTFKENKPDGTPNTGVPDRDPKVSGQIVMRGTAHDNSFIEGLYISVPGMEGVFTSAGLTVTQTVDSVTYYRIANNVSGTLMGTDKWSSDGFKFECPTADQTIGKGGHDVNWTFSWDTSKVTGVAKADVEVHILAYNKGTPTCASVSVGAPSVDGTTHYAVATYNNPIGSALDTTQTATGTLTNRYRMDVVPYITGLTTGLSKLGGTNAPDLYARTALGHYPVEDKETITVHGFNLADAACTVGGVNSGNLTPVTGKVNVWSLTLSANTKSGELVATVNSIAAINNTNSNDKAYNKGSKTANNDKLTDDVYLDVWQFNSKAAQPERGVITEPVMRINPSNGIIGFAFANGPDYFSMSNGKNDSYEKWQRNYDDYGNVDFVYDSEGKSHGVAVGRDINSGGNHGGKFTYFTSKWGPGNTSSQNANYTGGNGLRLEAIGQKGTMESATSGYILDKTRIQHPSLATVSKPGMTENGKPRLYLAYYDAVNDQIRFKYGTNDKNWNWEFGQFVDQENDSAVTSYNQSNVSIVAGGYKDGATIKQTGNKTGTYLSLGVVSGSSAASDTAVLIWFDETSRMLKYTYKTNPQNGNHASQSGDGNGNWKVPVDVFDKMNVGEYCKIAVDKNGGIHIAAFDSDAADLKYAYLSSYSDTAFKRSTVDSYGITGTYISLDVAYTENGTNGKPVPYIGYYSASAGRSKLAYLIDTATGVSGSAQGTDDSGYFTGRWEISVVPTVSRVQQDNINVGVWKTNTATDYGVIKASVSGNSNSSTGHGTVYGNGTANPVLGYAIKQSMNGYIETAQKK